MRAVMIASSSETSSAVRPRAAELAAAVRIYRRHADQGSEIERAGWIRRGRALGTDPGHIGNAVRDRHRRRMPTGVLKLPPPHVAGIQFVDAIKQINV